MNIYQLLAAVWRAKLLFVLTLLACLGAVVAVTLSLPKTYQATATLLVGLNKGADKAVTYDVNLGEQLTRTYATLAANPNVAEAARGRLKLSTPPQELLQRMSFAPVERTQLLQIRAEGRSPSEARTLANGYSAAFVERVAGQFAAGQTQATVSINEPAASPARAATPNPPIYIGLGTLVALVIALAVALLRERLDNRIRVAEDEDMVFGHPILARLPNVSGKRGRWKDIEAFGLLKTNIDLSSDNPAQVLLITSAEQGEGKSTVAARLATTALADGERVVLIEADPRRPGLGQRLEAAPAPVGLTNYLAGAADLDDVIVPAQVRLDVIWSGPMPPNFGALLGSPKFEALLDIMRRTHDRVIIDCSPVLARADASIIGFHADGTVYVIDVRRTTRSSVQAGLNQLGKARGRLLGMVLNRTSVGGLGYYAGQTPPDAVSPLELAATEQARHDGR
ncbi:MAG: polysaccharide biosynthesis tyrosine autokinase [Thermoleophilaceae bacterium]|nr:polysaccharide biosynthesis tyrosine autokinase [Thermoleophilaceae bacterium]